MARIDDYAFGRIEIGGETFAKDVIILPDRVAPNWWRKQGHWLDPEDLAAVWPEAPATLIIGTGYHGNMVVPPKTREIAAGHGVELVDLPTREAVERFNRLIEAGTGKVIAALHLTC